MCNNFDINKIEQQEGKVAIVTGANTGLGFLHSKILAQKGITVVFACRDEAKALEAMALLKSENVLAKVYYIPLDLRSISSVKAFSEIFLMRFPRLDFLVNNAAVVNLESKQLTPEKIEMHMATNHLGHFALTQYLFEVLIKTPYSKVITLTSGGYKVGKIDFDDLSLSKVPYNRIKAYGNSKLANLLFAIQLQNIFDKYAPLSKSLVCHPGLTASPRQQSIGIGGFAAKVLASPLHKGVLPQIRATFDDSLDGATLLGPKWGIWGKASIKPIEKEHLNKEVLESFWEKSEEVMASL